MPWLALGTTTHELRGGDAAVGSGADAAWRVTTADLMSRHFVVSTSDGSTTLRANSTEAVVVVNGAQLTTTGHALRDGDVILAGSGRFVFSLAAPSVAPVAESHVPQGYLVDARARMVHPLAGRSTPIGRDASNAIVVRDPTASRFHAEVRREAGGYALHSIGATGTTLNGQTVAVPTMLAEGDALEIAFLKLRFTARQPERGVAIATPHSTTNDEYARKPTLGDGTRQVIVEESNEAGRDGRRARLIAAVVVVLVVAVVWWFRR